MKWSPALDYYGSCLIVFICIIDFFTIFFVNFGWIEPIDFIPKLSVIFTKTPVEWECRSRN
jgi:hypothetical protein